MRRNTKKALYEKIMRNVAREVKRALNEDNTREEFLNLEEMDKEFEYNPNTYLLVQVEPTSSLRHCYSLQQVIDDLPQQYRSALMGFYKRTGAYYSYRPVFQPEVQEIWDEKLNRFNRGAAEYYNGRRFTGD